MERTYTSVAALVGRAAGPLASHLGQFVAWLIDQQYTASVIYVKARHAVAFDRWLAKRRVVVTDLGEAHIERYQRRGRRGQRCIRTETRRGETREVTTSSAPLLARSWCMPGRPRRDDSGWRSGGQLWATSSASAGARHRNDGAIQDGRKAVSPRAFRPRRGRSRGTVRRRCDCVRATPSETPATTGPQVCRERHALVPALRAISWRSGHRPRCRGTDGGRMGYHAVIAQGDITRACAACDRQL